MGGFIIPAQQAERHRQRDKPASAVVFDQLDREDPTAVRSRDMIDPQVIRIVERAVDAGRFAWSTRFQDEVGRVENDLAIRGLGQSGALLKAVADVCVKEIEIRATGIWEDLHRSLVMTGVRPSAELSTELKGVFNDFFRIYTDEPQRRFDGTWERMGGGSALRTATGFDGRVYGARAGIEAEIDLFARSLEQSARMNQSRGDTIFQIYAPVGAIQTGADAKANIVQTFDADAQKGFADLLRKIEGQLAEATTLEATQAAELRDAINETREEIEKPRASRSMLFAKLQVIAQLISTAIQSAPVLKSGYEALRNTLATYGIILP